MKWAIRTLQVLIVLLGMSAMVIGIRLVLEVIGERYQGLDGWVIRLAGAGFVLFIALITMVGAILIAWKMGSRK
jgi:hypothetical protein